MALDNANFIAELSIIDPPGTDPLSQGDDQIRTIKRATFQSFPLIAAAVNLTDVQLNLAAIKNQANIFTVADQQFTNLNIVKKSADTQVAGWSFHDFGDFNRWTMFIATLASNENLTLQRRDAGGTVIDIPWTVNLTTGVMDFLHVPTVQGAPLWIAGEIRMFVAGATPGTNWFLANGANGTVDLTDRILMNEGATAVGTALNAALGVSQAASGGTVLTEAQMPSHRHDIIGGTITGVAAGLSAANARVFLGAGSVTPAFISQTGFGDTLMQSTGANASHNHSVPVITIDNPTLNSAVRPLSQVVQMHQYVP
jgi:hypothetical protein